MTQEELDRKSDEALAAYDTALAELDSVARQSYGIANLSRDLDRWSGRSITAAAAAARAAMAKLRSAAREIETSEPEMTTVALQPERGRALAGAGAKLQAALDKFDKTLPNDYKIQPAYDRLIRQTLPQLIANGANVAPILNSLLHQLNERALKVAPAAAARSGYSDS